MNDDKCRVGLAVAIIALFFGVAVTPTIGISRYRNDTTPPVTTATLDPPEPIYEEWYGLSVKMTLNPTDNESGVNVTYYQINT